MILWEVVPNPAEAGEPVTAYLAHGDDCGYPDASTIQVNVAGNTVNVSSEFFIGCVGTPPLPPLAVELGAFQPGNYTVAYTPITEQGNLLATQYGQFVVLAESAPIAVPAVSWLLLSALILTFGIFAGRHLIAKGDVT